MDSERADWLHRLAEAARAASDDLRELDDPLLHRGLIQDLDEFHDRILAELAAAATCGDREG